MDRQPDLEGTLVRLRPLRDDDFPALFAIASDPRVWEQHPSKDRAQEPVFRDWFDEVLASGGALAVIDTSDGRIIGTSRFDAPDVHTGEIEIGWTFLAVSHWGGAYNGDMKQLMIRHAFRSVDTVVFRVHSHNARSQRAVEKLGAVRTGEEIDRHGRGVNVVYRLDAASYRSSAADA